MEQDYEAVRNFYHCASFSEHDASDAGCRNGHADPEHAAEINTLGLQLQKAGLAALKRAAPGVVSRRAKHT